MYNCTTPKNRNEHQWQTSKSEPKVSFGAVFSSFQKKQIGLALAFYLIIQVGESQLLKCLGIDNQLRWRNGLDTQDIWVIYGTFGVISLTMGEIVEV
jgi:PAT family beta-lactamase induction signal transducer AmpG